MARSLAASGLDVWGFGLLKHPAFWLLFICFFVQDGGVAMFINKIGGMIEAVHSEVSYDKEKLAIIFSLCNAAGRLGWGWCARCRVRCVCSP